MSDHDLGGDPACWAHLFDDDGETSGPVVADLGTVETTGAAGVVWSLPHGGDLDGNLVRLGPGDAIAEHVNDQVDVLVFVQSGDGRLTIDGEPHDLHSDVVALVPRGCRRRIVAGPRGVTYLSIHRRRGPLQVQTR